MKQINHEAQLHGVVVKFDPERGYGFIRPPDGGPDVFVNITQVARRRALVPGQRVTYRLTRTARGPAATDVQPGSTLGTPYWRYALIGLGGALAGILGIRLVVGASFPAPFWAALWIATLSVAAFVLYGFDKGQAQSGGTRVPELVLHGFSLLGGSPGAFVAMRFFHHKTRKPVFQLIFWLIAAAQIGVLVFFVLNAGSE